MYLRWLFYAIALLNVVFGLGFFFAPEAVATAYGGAVDATAIGLARYWAATMLPLAWVAYVAGNAGGSPLKLTLVRAFEFIAILNFVVTFLAMQAGIMSTTGAIVNYVLSAIFTVGFGYYGWAKTSAATT